MWGTNEEEHNERLEQTLKRAEQRNLKLNKDKSRIKQKEISYLGHIISEDGIKPDPNKVAAIVDMKSPQSKEELQRFLGMTTYLSKFIPDYSETSVPLRVLLEQKTEWHWTETQELGRNPATEIRRHQCTCSEVFRPKTTGHNFRRC